MIFFNRPGLLGTLPALGISIAVVTGLDLPRGPAVFHAVYLTGLLASVFAFFYDRTDARSLWGYYVSLWRSYLDWFGTGIADHRGWKLHPERRTAITVAPLALLPWVILLCFVVAWVKARVTGANDPVAPEYARFVLFGAGYAVVSALLAILTARFRVIRPRTRGTPAGP
jgi:hypothetical protein